MASSTLTTDTVRTLAEGDLDAAVAVHRRSFPGYPNVLLGSRYVKTMLRWFCSAPQGIALGAFDGGGELVGYVIGAPVDRVKQLGRDLRPATVVGFATHPWLFVHPRILFTIWSRVRDRFVEAPPYEMPEIPTPCMGLFSIAVAAEAGGRGIGQKLMATFETESRRYAMRSMYLSVFPQNAAARRVYEKAGWTPLPVPPKPGDAMHYLRTLNAS
jgi:GNAT superfamily N-acetyltransferase